MIEACIAPIYEASLDPDGWQAAIDRMSDAFGGAKVLLMHTGVRTVDGALGWSRGIDPSSYGEVPPEVQRPEGNPALRVALAAPVGFRFDRRQFIGDDGHDRHRVAREFFHPTGMFHLMLSTVQRDAETASFLLVSRSRKQTPFEGAEGPALAELVRHVGRAMRTHRVLRLSEARGLAFAQALERLAGGVVLADAGLRVLHANAAAERMLDAGEGIGRRLGRLAFGDPRAQRELDQAARRLSGAAPQLAEVQFEVWRQGRRPLQVTVLPALGGAAAAVTPRGQLLIIVRDPERSTPPREPSVIAASFGVTPAEARVAALVATAAPTREVADRLGLSENTVKTHLKAVFLKTGARNRADLMRLMLAAAS
jgi:DNA-binding CsgD family transcriptional regulator